MANIGRKRRAGRPEGEKRIKLFSNSVFARCDVHSTYVILYRPSELCASQKCGRLEGASWRRSRFAKFDFHSFRDELARRETQLWRARIRARIYGVARIFYYTKIPSGTTFFRWNIAYDRRQHPTVLLSVQKPTPLAGSARNRKNNSRDRTRYSGKRIAFLAAFSEKEEEELRPPARPPSPSRIRAPAFRPLFRGIRISYRNCNTHTGYPLPFCFSPIRFP